MLNDTELLQLRKAVEQEANSEKLILGARVGEIIKKEFPSLNVKAEYRSLSKLIETHLADWLVVFGSHGQDVMYTLDLSRRPLPESHLSYEDKLRSEPVSPRTKAKPTNTAPSPDQSDTEQLLRQTIKTAIDAMTIEQLRQLVLPAGIMFDATNKVNHH